MIDYIYEGIMPGYDSTQKRYFSAVVTMFLYYLAFITLSVFLIAIIKPIGVLVSLIGTGVFILMALSCLAKRLLYLNYNLLWLMVAFMPVVNILFVLILMMIADKKS